MNYTTGMVRELLSNYQSRAQNARPRPPEDRLGTQQAPLDEAPWASSSRVWSDVEVAMRLLPFNWEKIVFAELCLGGGREDLRTGWRNGMSRHHWREKVGGFWGLKAREVKEIVDRAVNEMADTLNGVAVTNDPV